MTSRARQLAAVFAAPHPALLHNLWRDDGTVLALRWLPAKVDLQAARHVSGVGVTIIAAPTAISVRHLDPKDLWASHKLTHLPPATRLRSQWARH